MIKGFSKLFVVVGGVCLAGAVLWWRAFYSQVIQFLGGNGGLPIECVYTIGGPCSMVASTANAFGATAYDPRLFWAAFGAIVIGVILWLLPDDGEDDSYRPQERRDRDPHL